LSQPDPIEAADAVAETFGARAGGGPDALGAGYWLGAVAAARAARRSAEGLGWTDRVADLALSRRGQLGEVGETEAARAFSLLVVDDPAPCAAALLALEAAAHGQRELTVLLGPRAAPYVTWIEGAIRPRFGDRADVRAETDLAAAARAALDGRHEANVAVLGRGDEADAMTKALGADRIGGASAVVVAPYYWDRRDLDRIARHLVLEVLAAPPGTTRVRLLIAAGWEQRSAVLEDVEERLAACTAAARAPHEVVVLDARDALETLHAARRELHADPAAALSVFVHGMHREHRGTSAALVALARTPGVATACFGHRASVPCVLGAWGRGNRSLIVDAGGSIPSVASPALARARAIYESRPSAGGAAGLALRTVIASAFG
jgi:hypothetical protein